MLSNLHINRMPRPAESFHHRLPFMPRRLHNPPLQQRGEAMTLALGFKCSDGIVLGADSEISTDTSKWSERKILDFPKLKSHPYFAYATDDVDFAKGVIERLAVQIERAERGNSNIVAGLKGELKSVQKEYSRTYPKKDERPIFQLLMALREQTLALFMIRGVECTPVSQAGYIGSGEPVGRAVATPLFSNSLTTSDAERLAVYTLMQAKEYVPYVGKRSYIVQIWESPDPLGPFQWWSDQEEVKEMEDDFRVFQGALQPILTGCYFGAFDDEGKDDFPEKLKTFSQTIKDQRRKRLKHSRRLHQEGGTDIEGLKRELGS
jgi:20S proteasome alpha/beta subunit